MNERVPGPRPRSFGDIRRTGEERQDASFKPVTVPTRPAGSPSNPAPLAQLASSLQASPRTTQQGNLAAMMNAGRHVAGLRQLVGIIRDGARHKARQAHASVMTDSRTGASNHEGERRQPSGPGVVQGHFLDIENKNFKGFIAEQAKKQRTPEAIDSGFTTVGLEHEFTQTVDKNRLAGISHLELAKSTPLPYTGLPFILETDAANALELVSPPFLIKTLPETRVPNPADVEEVDELIRKDLLELSRSGTIGRLVERFREIGLDFKAVEDLTIEPKNVSHKSEPKDYSQVENSSLTFEALKDIKIKPTEKGGGITSQVNFATDAATLDQLQQINQEKTLSSEKQTPGFNPKAIIASLEDQLKTLIDGTSQAFTTGNPKIFANQLARTLAGQLAVPAIKAVGKIQKQIFQNKGPKAGSSEAATFRLSAYLSSAVKDVHGVWIKDSLMNIGLGLLSRDEWARVKQLVTDPGFKSGISGLSLPKFTNINGFEENPEEGNALISGMLVQAKALIVEALGTVADQIDRVSKDGREPSSLAIVPVEEVGFMEHNEGMIGPRQDTFIDPRKAQIPGAGARLHVAETRKDGIRSLYELGLKSRTLDLPTLRRLQTQKLKEIAQYEAEIGSLEQQLTKLKREPAEWQDEFLGNELELQELEKSYREALQAYKVEYRQKNAGSEPSATLLGRFEKKTRSRKQPQLERRQETLIRMFRAFQETFPAQEKNIDAAIRALLDARAESRTFLKDVESQLQ